MSNPIAWDEAKKIEQVDFQLRYAGNGNHMSLKEAQISEEYNFITYMSERSKEVRVAKMMADSDLYYAPLSVPLAERSLAKAAKKQGCKYFSALIVKNI